MSNQYYIGGTAAMQSDDGECDENKSIFRHISDVAKGTPSQTHVRCMVKAESILDRIKRINAQHTIKKETSP